MTGRIRQRLQSGNADISGVKINPHYPPVIEALRNEAMKERRRLLNANNSNQRIVVTMQGKKPWVVLVKITGSGREKREKVSLPFPLEDSRLADPGKCLAELALEDKEFVPKEFLDEEEQLEILPGEYPAGPLTQRRRRGAMDTT